MLKPVTEFLRSCAVYLFGTLSSVITSVTGYIFGDTDDDSTDSDYDFGLNDGWGGITPSPPLNEATPLLNQSKQYTHYSALAADQKGKNKTACIFRSNSKKTGERKLWISKRRSDSRIRPYDVNAITTEIYVAWLYVFLFGKDNAPKAKFHPDFHGVLSRVIGDDKDATNDLFTAFISGTEIAAIPKEAHASFLRAIVFAIVVGNRDITFENFVFKDPEDLYDEIIYLIDNEYALAPPLQKPTQPLLAAGSFIREHHMSLHELLITLDDDPKKVSRIILDWTFDWNNLHKQNADEATIARINTLFFEFFTRDAFRNTLQKIVCDIEARDFEICATVKAKMLQQLAKYPETYSQELVDGTIIPRIDDATRILKENVACIHEFLVERGLQAVTPTRETSWRLGLV